MSDHGFSTMSKRIRYSFWGFNVEVEGVANTQQEQRLPGRPRLRWYDTRRIFRPLNVWRCGDFAGGPQIHARKQKTRFENFSPRRWWTRASALRYPPTVRRTTPVLNKTRRPVTQQPTNKTRDRGRKKGHESRTKKQARKTKTQTCSTVILSTSGTWSVMGQKQRDSASKPPHHTCNSGSDKLVN